MEKIKKIFSFEHIFHFLSISALLGSLILVFTKYKVILDRFISSLIYLKDAFINWIRVNFLHMESDLISNVDSFDVIEILPLNFDGAKVKLSNYFATLFSKEVFFDYCRNFFIDFLLFFLYLVVVVACLIALYTIVDVFVTIPISDNLRGKKTPFVLFYNKYIEAPIFWLLTVLTDFVKAFCSKSYYKIPFLIVWLLNFNILTIIAEIVAFVFAFSSCFGLDVLFDFFIKLNLDTFLAFLTSPLIVLLTVIGVVVFIRLKKMAKKHLESLLQKSKDIVRNSSPSIMLSGPQGAGKSLLGAFIIRLIEIIFHEELSDNLYQFQMEYVDFPFLMFEDEIREQKKLGNIKGLTGVADFVNRKKEIFEATGDINVLYGYAGPLEFNNGVRYIDIFEMLVEYGKSFYIYIDDNSLAVTAIPVRTDLFREDIGNFPLWNHDVLNRTPDDFDKYSKYSKVLVYDAFRCGNFHDKDSKFVGAFEYGAVWEPEKDKERGNKVTNAKYDLNSDKANPLNDLFSFGQKIRRHSSNINYKSFWRSVADLQRPNSLNLDEMDLYDHLQILKKNTQRVAFPFYFLFQIVFDLLDNVFRSFIDTCRFYGTEFTFPAYIMRKSFSLLFKLQIRILSIYGYSYYKLEKTEACQHNKKAEEIKFPFVNALGYADIYKSDSLQPFFSELVRLAGVSLADFPDYDSPYLITIKMKEQGSYLGDTLSEVLEKRKNNSSAASQNR